MKRKQALTKPGKDTQSIILAASILALAIASLTLGGCFGFGSSPCDDLTGESLQQADACYGTWNQGETFSEASGTYSIQWVDHNHHDPTDGWFDSCTDQAWTRELVIVEHASGANARPGTEARVVYHERRECAWNVRCFAADSLLRNDVTLSSGTNPISGLEGNCDR